MSHNTKIINQLRALVLVGNALFLAVQAATHPRRVLDIAMQVLRREQSSKFANAIEPMRRRREVFRKLSAHGAPASTSPDAQARRTPHPGGTRDGRRRRSRRA